MNVRSRLPRLRIIPLVGAVVAAVVIAGGLWITVDRVNRTPMRTISALFAQAPGLYAGNHVEVLSMPVGSITSITPRVGGVLVKMSVERKVKVPANASAVLMAPQVVNDRGVALTPVYRGGPAMADNATIPMNRTAEPLSVDQVLGTLDTLFKALGPTAADKQGVLSSLIAQLNSQLDGQGQPLHDTIASATQATGGLVADAPQLATTLTQLSSFVSTLAADSANYQSFTSNLASAADQLNGEKTQLAGALSTLGQTLSDVTTFVRANGATIGSTLDRLNTAVAAVASQQHSLAQALNLLPLAGQNLNNTVGTDYSVPGHPTKVIQARLDQSGDSLGLLETVCGSILPRAAAFGLDQNKASVLDVICPFGGAVSELARVPGSPAGPDLSLTDLLKASR